MTLKKLLHLTNILGSYWYWHGLLDTLLKFTVPK